MSRIPASFRALRTCYRHPAGEIGVALTAALNARGVIEHVATDKWLLGGYRLTDTGRQELTALGVEIGPITPGALDKACADWTQRLPDGTRGVPHLGGRLGGALTDWLLKSGAAVRLPHPATIYESRTLVLTRPGRELLRGSGLLAP